MERSNGLPVARIQAVRDALTGAEKRADRDAARALTQLAVSSNSDVSGSPDQPKSKLLVGALSDLAKAR